jgi:hypothetical protein
MEKPGASARDMKHLRRMHKQGTSVSEARKLLNLKKHTVESLFDLWTNGPAKPTVKDSVQDTPEAPVKPRTQKVKASNEFS